MELNDEALSWVTVVEEDATTARAAAELQADLRQNGTPLAARDALVAGVARALDEPLAVADAEFRTNCRDTRRSVISPQPRQSGFASRRGRLQAAPECRRG